MLGVNIVPSILPKHTPSKKKKKKKRMMKNKKLQRFNKQPCDHSF